MGKTMETFFATETEKRQAETIRELRAIVERFAFQDSAVYSGLILSKHTGAQKLWKETVALAKRALAK